VLHLVLHDPLQLTIFLQACSLLIVGSVVLRIPLLNFHRDRLVSWRAHYRHALGSTELPRYLTYRNRKALRAKGITIRPFVKNPRFSRPQR